MLRKLLYILLCLFCIAGVIYVFFYVRWNHLWSQRMPFQTYRIQPKCDDTLRVVVIGDSWAEMHSKMEMDTFLRSSIQKKVSCSVSVVSKGKGGEKCRGIYQLMFEKNGYGTKPLFDLGPDYCVIFAGINDAAANWGIKQYCYHYKLIIDFLLRNSIIPVVIETPDVDIWNMNRRKPIKDLIADFMKSTMTQCAMYNYREYREALYKMLVQEKLLDKVLYVSVEKWNGYLINPIFFAEDKVHLNSEGYRKLDEIIATEIVYNLKQSENSTTINSFVH